MGQRILAQSVGPIVVNGYSANLFNITPPPLNPTSVYEIAYTLSFTAGSNTTDTSRILRHYGYSYNSLFNYTVSLDTATSTRKLLFVALSDTGVSGALRAGVSDSGSATAHTSHDRWAPGKLYITSPYSNRIGVHIAQAAGDITTMQWYQVNEYTKD